MYGFVNRAIQLLVERNFGQETWLKIVEEAGLDPSASFLLRKTYGDDMTYALVMAGEKVLGVPAAAILELFGNFFFEFCVENGYDRILAVLGSTPKDFLNNLDALHDHLGSIYPEMHAPSFRCSEHANGTVLHYYSDRPSLEPIVRGLVQTVSKTLHDTDVQCNVLHAKGENGLDHCQFLIEGLDKASSAREHASLDLPPLDAIMSAESFSLLWPFHLKFNEDFHVCDCGATIARIVPRLVETETPVRLDDVFSLVRPRVEFTYHHIVSQIYSVVVLATRPGMLAAPAGPDVILRIKGQMVLLEESNEIIFFCSPSVTSLDDLAARGIALSDIPVHDMSRELVLMSERFEEEYQIAQNLEVLTDQLQQTTKAVDIEKGRTETLLYSVLPKHVARALKANETVPGQRHPNVTVMFTSIVGFDEFCVESAQGPAGAIQIVRLLNLLFSKFDEVADRNPKVYKIETVNDHYLAISGAPDRCVDHARAMTRFALDMKQLSDSLVNESGRPIDVTFGLNSGEVVSGVIGNRAPRYCLFGNTVNTSSRAQSTGVPGKINLTAATYEFLQDEENYDERFFFKLRGQVSMKGRGLITMYTVRRLESGEKPQERITHADTDDDAYIVKAQAFDRVSEETTATHDHLEGDESLRKTSKSCLCPPFLCRSNQQQHNGRAS